MRRIGLFVLIAIIVAPLGVFGADDLVYVRAGGLIDVQSGELRRDQVITIRGDRVEHVGAAGDVTIEQGATVIDLGVAYRLPGRHGLITLNLNNVFDEEFRFQDLDPENPSIFPERFLSLRFTLAYDR